MRASFPKSISVTPEQWQRVLAACERHNTTPSQLIRDLCMDHLYPTHDQWRELISRWLPTSSKRREAIRALQDHDQQNPETIQ